jgi:hypothetical protein
MTVMWVFGWNLVKKLNYMEILFNLKIKELLIYLQAPLMKMLWNISILKPLILAAHWNLLYILSHQLERINKLFIHTFTVKIRNKSQVKNTPSVLVLKKMFIKIHLSHLKSLQVKQNVIIIWFMKFSQLLWITYI